MNLNQAAINAKLYLRMQQSIFCEKMHQKVDERQKKFQNDYKAHYYIVIRKEMKYKENYEIYYIS